MLAVPAIGRSAAVSAMIALLFVHQLLEYIATVALWSWWGDLVPPAIRGRYFARRQAVQLAVSIPLLLASGVVTDRLRERWSSNPDTMLLAYAVPTALGAALLLGSLVPLAMMPGTRRYPRPEARLAWRAIWAPLVDRRFRRLLVFRCWFSLANGISQTVQNVIYPKDVLTLGVAPLQALKVTTQLGQLAASGPVGRLSDRIGNRPVLAAAQACVSASLVFYLLATGPATWWWLVARGSCLRPTLPTTSACQTWCWHCRRVASVPAISR